MVDNKICGPTCTVTVRDRDSEIIKLCLDCICKSNSEYIWHKVKFILLLKASERYDDIKLFVLPQL